MSQPSVIVRIAGDQSPFVTMTLAQAAALGRIPGASNRTAFGVCNSLQTSTPPCALWPLQVPRVRLYTNTALEILSSSANDTLLGTGAQQVAITSVDQNFVETNSVINLNGTTPVAIPQGIFINASVVGGSGSGRKNAGNITIRTVSGANPQSYIEAGAGLARLASFCVPANCIWICHNFFSIMDAGTTWPAQVRIETVIILPNGNEIKALPLRMSATSPASIPVPDGFTFTAGQILEYQISLVTDNNSFTSFGLTGTLIDTTQLDLTLV